MLESNKEEKEVQGPGIRDSGFESQVSGLFRVPGFGVGGEELGGLFEAGGGHDPRGNLKANRTFLKSTSVRLFGAIGWEWIQEIVNLPLGCLQGGFRGGGGPGRSR